MFRTNCHALAAYEPRSYPGPLMLVRALNGADDHVDPTLGWAALASGRVSTHVIPGDHYSLLQRPTVELLEAIVRVELDESETPA